MVPEFAVAPVILLRFERDARGWARCGGAGRGRGAEAASSVLEVHHVEERGKSKDAGSCRGVPEDAEGASAIDKAMKHRLQLKSKAPIRLVGTRRLQQLESVSVKN